MKKKIVISMLLSLTLVVGLFSAGNVSKAHAAAYKYNWAFKTQQMTVKLDTNYSVTGYEVYRGFTNKVGITMNYKVSAAGLQVTSVNSYRYGVMWPISVSDKSKVITKAKAKINETATANSVYTGRIKAPNGVVLLTEYPITEGQLKLISINNKTRTAVVKFTGALRH